MNIKEMYSYLLFIWYIILIILFIYIYFRYYKQYNSEYINKKTTKIPSNINPLNLSILMYNKINTNTFISTIYFLIFKNKIIIEKDNNEYILKLNCEKMKLSDSQNYILKTLFEQIGDGMNVTMTQLNEYCNSKYNKQEFNMNYFIWKKTAYKECANNNFYKPKYIYFKMKLISVITLLLFILGIIINRNQLIIYLLIPFIVILAILIEKSNKRTKEANDEYYKWLSYKNYLKNSKINDNPEINLIYGTILEIDIIDKLKLENKECFKQLEISLKNNLKKIKGDL